MINILYIHILKRDPSWRSCAHRICSPVWWRTHPNLPSHPPHLWWLISCDLIVRWISCLGIFPPCICVFSRRWSNAHIAPLISTLSTDLQCCQQPTTPPSVCAWGDSAFWSDRVNSHTCSSDGPSNPGIVLFEIRSVPSCCRVIRSTAFHDLSPPGKHPLILRHWLANIDGEQETVYWWCSWKNSWFWLVFPFPMLLFYT